MKADVHHQVVTAADVRRAQGSIEVSNNAVITPSARDLAESLGVKFVPVATEVVTQQSEYSRSDANRTTVLSREEIAARIDHSNLSPLATAGDIARLCDEAVQHGFAAVCVNPVRVRDAVAHLQDARTVVCGVVGFPGGAHETSVKEREAAGCIDSGAREIDMAANTGLLRDNRVDLYHADIHAVRSAIGHEVLLKVIIEASLLNQEDLIRAATLAAHAGANFVKTSTGVYAQARLEDVALLRRVLPADVKIKAAGGIRTAESALAFITAGADRIGTSASIAILQGAVSPAPKT